jgi:hypothetical protein
MIYNLNKINEKNIAIRLSEFESIESVELVKKMVSWVWVDSFDQFPLSKNIYDKIKTFNLKIIPYASYNNNMCYLRHPFMGWT